MFAFLRFTRCLGPVSEGVTSVPAEAVDCVSRSLGGRSIQLDLGNAETDMVLLRLINGAMRQHGPTAANA
jgi:hypothetical protein